MVFEVLKDLGRELVLDCKRKPAEDFIPIFKLGVLEKFPEKLLY